MLFFFFSIFYYDINVHQDGQFFFIEHVAYEPMNELWTLIQCCLEPIWKFVLGGCCLRKPTWVYLENAGFSSITLTRECSASLPAILRPHVWGFASK